MSDNPTDQSTDAQANQAVKIRIQLLLKLIAAICLGGWIGANYTGAGEIDTGPRIPEYYTLLSGSIAGVVSWTIATFIFPFFSRDFGKILGALATGAICGMIYFLIVPAFYWNDVRILVALGSGFVLGGMIGPILYAIGLLPEIGKHVRAN